MDQTISELARATAFEPDDLMVLERSGEAMAIPEGLLIKTLTEAADGHGGIRSIQKTGTAGLVDTYTVTLADGTTYAIPVTNGEKGEKGEQGEKGDKGDPPPLTMREISYQVSDSGTSVPSGPWKPVPQAAAQGKYLWTRTRIVFNQNDIVVFYGVSYMGLDGQGAARTQTVTLERLKWQDNLQTVKVTGVTADNIVVVSPAAQAYIAYTDALVRCVEQTAGALTFLCEAAPEVDIPVNVLTFGTEASA